MRKYYKHMCTYPAIQIFKYVRIYPSINTCGDTSANVGFAGNPVVWHTLATGVFTFEVNALVTWRLRLEMQRQPKVATDVPIKAIHAMLKTYPDSRSAEDDHNICLLRAKSCNYYSCSIFPVTLRVT